LIEQPELSFFHLWHGQLQLCGGGCEIPLCWASIPNFPYRIARYTNLGAPCYGSAVTLEINRTMEHSLYRLFRLFPLFRSFADSRVIPVLVDNIGRKPASNPPLRTH
jgi:hypothetical protein